MLIVCPACSASYEVPDSLLRKGRAVRCSRCGDQWVPLAATAEEEPANLPAVADDPVPDAPAEPAGTTAMDRLAAGSVPLPVDRILAGAWLASVVVLVLLGVAMVAFRAELMTGWPPSARLFAAVGLAVPAPHP